MTRTTLVMGGSGFLGSRVIRQLLERGDTVRVWVRPSSASAAFDGLDVEVVRGELDDPVGLRAAMVGVDAVHYCIVDTRAWLRDPAPLFHTNVELLGGVIDAALETAVPRFVFCSTVGTIGIVKSGLADETHAHNWLRQGGPYIASRVQAENRVLEAVRDRGLPAVVLNVGTTYGSHDTGPTPHGMLVRSAARSKMPAYVRGASMEVVSIDDAARAFVLAEEKGRVGERYIISESYLKIDDLFRIVADEAGVEPPRIGIPLPVMAIFGRVNGALAALRGRDTHLNATSVRLMHIQSALDHSKAVRELGWEPAPTEGAIRAGVRWFGEQWALRHAT